MGITQLSVFLENKPGELAVVTSLFSENNIDLRAINIAETSDYGIIRIIVNNSKRAAEVLTENGYIFSTTTLMAISVKDTAGSLNDVLGIISKAKIDIEYMYSMLGKNNAAYMLFKAKNEKNFEKIFAENNIKLATKEEIGMI